jgi:hypothetical protein
MKQIYFLIVLFGALLFCACEKENIDPLVEDQVQSQTEESALKDAKSKGHIKTEFLPPLPYWARMGAGTPLGIPATDEYGIIYFYVDNPYTTVDPNFNLFNFFQFPDFTVTPPVFGPFDPSIVWTIEGYLWWETGYDPLTDVPFLTHLTAKEPVTFWIITREQVETIWDNGNGEIKIKELYDVYDPMVGEATFFNEVLRPWGDEGLVAPVAGIQTTAHGVIIDGILNGNEIAQVGSKFNFSYHTKSTEPPELEKCMVKFNILDK